MTKITIAPNASGSGTFTLAAPNSNTDRTFTLPDATGEVLTDQSNIEAQVKTATNASGSAPIYACRAWVNFDGRTGGTTTIRGSGNVSSVTKISTGQYHVNFTIAMPDVNYSPVAGVSGNTVVNFAHLEILPPDNNPNFMIVRTFRSDNSALEDFFFISAAAFR